jgi:hypothetical protein
MAVQKEVWIPAIEENLYRGIELIAQVATDDSQYVQNKTVHIPNAGAAPTVSRGNSTYPVVVTERTDTDVDYTLTNFEVGPVRLGWADQLQLSYDKVQSITNDFMGNMNETLKNYFLSQFYTYDANTIVATDATATVSNWLSGSASLKVLRGRNVRTAAKILDRMKVPSGDRYLLLDYEMFWQLIGDVAYNSARLEVLAGFPATIDNIYGFKVIQLPFVAAQASNSTGAVLTPGAADGSFTLDANSRPLGLAFHKSFVSWAKTGVEGFVQNSDPTMFGDILSASVWGGAKYRRTDKAGVVAIRATA